MDNTTTTVAAAAVTSPFWFHWLQTASEAAAIVTPILGAIWLIVQITSRLLEAVRKNHRED